MGFRVYLDANFQPVAKDRATLVKVVGDDGRLTFYRPNKRNETKAELPRIAVPEWAARKLGNEMGVEWANVDIEQFRMGLEEEQEHAATVDGDMRTMAKIALDHLKEDPAYYSKLRGAMGEGK